MALKVFNFKCINGHRFEAMVAGIKDFEDQRAAGLFTCPYCNTTKVERALSAPHIAKSQSSTKEITPESIIEDAFKEMKNVIETAENVGDKFPEEARAMHSGLSERKAIIGTAKTEEIKELLDEGIPVLPIAPKDDKQIN